MILHRAHGFTPVSIFVFVLDARTTLISFTLLLGLGNCGKYNGDNDMIVAISKQRYDANRGANCDQVSLVYPKLQCKVLTMSAAVCPN